MRLIRFVSGGSVFLGQIEPENYTHARRVDGDPLVSMSVSNDVLPVDRLLSPIVPTDILCIGLNYRQHAEETGATLTKHPLLFIKSSNSLNHPGGEIPLPALSQKVDWEAELAVVIGRNAKRVAAADALDYVLGYTCANDVSARDWQKDRDLGGGQFARGKSFDGFCPLGPCLVTADELREPNTLRIACDVNGERVQDSSTSDMIADVPTLIESLSSTMTLRAGSVILTGTPSGVGAAMTPPRFLKPGDAVVVEIEQIGRLENTGVAE